MQINRQELLDQITKIKPGIGNGQTIQNSDCIAFKKGSAFSFNGEIVMQVPCPEMKKVEGMVKAEPLFHLLSKLSDEKLEIEVKDNEWSFVSEHGEAVLKTIADISSAPIELEIPIKWKILSSSMQEGISFCSFSVGQDASRPTLTGIHIHEDMIETTDGFRLTQYRMKKTVKKELLIPLEVASLVRKEMKGYGLTKDHIHFSDKEGFVLSGRMMEGQYPDFNPLLKFEGEAFPFSEGLKEAVDRVSIFTKAEFTQDEWMKISVNKNKMIVEGQNDYGRYKEFLSMQGKGKECVFKVRPSFLEELLKLGVEKVLLGDGKLKVEGKNFIHIVCLLRSDDE